jgi:hypothetical protein
MSGKNKPKNAKKANKRNTSDTDNPIVGGIMSGNDKSIKEQLLEYRSNPEVPYQDISVHLIVPGSNIRDASEVGVLRIMMSMKESGYLAVSFNYC